VLEKANAASQGKIKMREGTRIAKKEKMGRDGLGELKGGRSKNQMELRRG